MAEEIIHSNPRAAVVHMCFFGNKATKHRGGGYSSPFDNLVDFFTQWK